MLTFSHLVFEPLLPLWLLLLGVIPILLVGVLNRRLSRILLALVLAGVLSGPMAEKTTLQPEKDVVAILTDLSPSNLLEPRKALTEAALENIKQQLAAFENIEPVFMTVEGTAAQGTNLFRQAQARLQSIPQDRLSAIIALTDAELTDLPEAASLPAPVHIMNTTPKDAFDRRLIVHQAPAFALLGKPQTLVVEVQDRLHDAAEVTVILGAETTQMLLPTNSRQELQVTFDHAGTNALRLITPAVNGELTDRNNHATQLVTGVRENLTVLLVSGLPHNGSKVIRDLLKSDPAVNLVHFTILRTTSKLDPTPDNKLSLIPFPVDELFKEELEKFDLIIFDRYFRRNFLSTEHFENIKAHIRSGKALLVLTGPDYSTEWGLANTPLQDILPAKPTGDEYKTVFKPHLSAEGNRHPITAPFAENAENWGRMAAITPTQPVGKGRILMTGANNLPLMMTAEVDQGRIGVWLSSNWWFWSRGIDGGGPQTELLRRMTHWLMRQPELEEKRLNVNITGGQMTIQYHQVDPLDSLLVEISPPEGTPSAHTLYEKDGFELTLPATADGLYTVRAENGVLAYGVKGNVRDLEWRSHADLGAVEALAVGTGGSFSQLSAGKTPQLRRIAAGGRLSGPGWVGLPIKDSALQTGTERAPLLPAWLGLLLVLLALTLTWWLEAIRFQKK